MGSPKDSERISRNKLESKFCELYQIKKIKDTGSTRIGNKAVADQGQRLMMTIRPT